MRVRIFFKDSSKDVMEWEDVIKICDDHGHVIFTEEESVRKEIYFPKQKAEPIPFMD